MIRKLIAVAIVAIGFSAAVAPAQATCVPGKVGVENGRPVVQLPRCDGPPR